MTRGWPFAALAYAAIAAAMGHRVLGSLSASIASDAGDPLLTTAILTWNVTRLPWTDAWFQFPIFFPTANALTLSEHLLGVGVIFNPLYWLTGNPVTAYNLTLLLSYPLCGLAMYALVWRLTHDAAAAFLAGLAFAFAPYRAGQLPHIQVLTVFWAPLALLALHAFVESRDASSDAARWPWLMLFALAWLLQGAANGYLLVFFSTVVAAWVLWFVVARRRWRDAGLVAGSLVIAVLPLLPIVYRYVTTQRELGLARNLGEIASFGADIAGPLCAPRQLAFWGWLRVACGPEGELFPGVALVAACVAGAIVALRHRDAGAVGAARETAEPALRGAHPRLASVRAVVGRLALTIAAVYVLLAVSVMMAGPWRLDLGWLRASASSADKPISVALVLTTLAFVLSDRCRAMVARGSTLTFYAGAAAVCWVLSWGPFPRFFGVEALYQAPYAWLLVLPGADALRVPARFWMMTVLCLAVVAGLVMTELLRSRSRRAARAVVTAAAALILVDGWATMPVAAVPPSPVDAGAVRGAPVLVEPAGELARDVAVVFHAVTGGWTAINGFSGYEPGYYEALRTLSQAGDPAAVDALTRFGEMVVVGRDGVMRREPARTATPSSSVSGERLDARGVDASCAPEGMSLATDGDTGTRWVCGAQSADHHITFDLGRVAGAGGITYALGSLGADFPRQLVVETSVDGVSWLPAWQGSPAEKVLQAAMDDPRTTRIAIPFASRPARYVRLRQTGRHERNYWSIAELAVWSGAAGG